MESKECFGSQCLVCSMKLDLKHPTTTSEPVTAPGDVLEVRCTIDLDTYMDPMSCNCFLCISKLSCWVLVLLTDLVMWLSLGYICICC
jgi:hypothetical protein